MRTGIALGSNLGDRLENLRAARDLLKSISSGPLLQAPIFRTAPVDCPEGSPDFYNTVIEISYDGSAVELLAVTQGFQRQLGRLLSKEKNAPRLIDIDLLYFGNETILTKDLELPHPRLASRRFVLGPLAEICPDLILPGKDVDVSELLGNLEDPALDIVTRDW